MSVGVSVCLLFVCVGLSISKLDFNILVASNTHLCTWTPTHTHTSRSTVGFVPTSSRSKNTKLQTKSHISCALCAPLQQLLVAKTYTHSHTHTDAQLHMYVCRCIWGLGRQPGSVVWSGRAYKCRSRASKGHSP